MYDRLSVADANDYEKLKDALLKNFDMTECGFRKKFRNDRPERSETFIQFGSRLRSYLDKWINRDTDRHRRCLVGASIVSRVNTMVTWLVY